MMGTYPAYNGCLGRNLCHANADIKFAVRAHANQTKRCTNKNDKRYGNYGARGLMVEYSRRQLIQWYLDQIELYGRVNDPTIGRIDHSKGYSFDNIKVESRIENSKERIQRLGTPHMAKPINIYDRNTGELLMVAKHFSEAIVLTGMSRNTIIRHIKHYTKPSAKHIYKLEYRGEP